MAARGGSEQTTVPIRNLPAISAPERSQLALLLVDCVSGGASVGFMNPLTLERADAYWQGVDASLRRGERALLVAQDGEGIVGTVQLVYAQPENQPHRADVSKMLVLRRARRSGIGAALLQALEALALERGRTVLVLDTASADAERLYERVGWRRTGVIPRYALLPDGGWCDTTVFYRMLGPAAP